MTDDTDRVLYRCTPHGTTIEACTEVKARLRAAEAALELDADPELVDRARRQLLATAERIAAVHLDELAARR